MEKLNLYQKLVEIRKCIPFLKKDTKGYNYKYVSGASVLTQIQDKMNELGVLLVPSVTDSHLHQDHYVTTNSRGQVSTKEIRIVSAGMLMTWIDAESGEKLEVPWLLFGEQEDCSKAFGSGLTYSERYFILKFFNVPTDEDDPDSRQDKKPPEKPEDAPQATKDDIPDFITPSQLAIVDGYLLKLDITRKGLAGWLVSKKKLSEPDVTKLTQDDATAMVRKWDDFSADIKMYSLNMEGREKANA